MVLVVLVVNHLQNYRKRSANNSPDSDGGSGDGGWDNDDDLNPLDLPPGVYVLPPGHPDPSHKPDPVLAH